MGNLHGSQVQIREVNAPVTAANNTDDNSDRIDMQNWEGVCFVVPITDCADTGVATLTVEQNTADSDSGMAALSGGAATKTSAADDDLNDKLLIVDVYRPTERYVQAVITSTVANIAFGNTLAILYGPRKKPVSDHSSVLDAEEIAGPAEA